MIELLFAYYFILNLLAFLIMGIDKYKAIHHHFRINEQSLLMIAILGGSFGEWIGMVLFHHKIKKKKFAIGIPFLMILHLLLLLICFDFI